VRAAALVAIAALGSLACGGLLGLAEPTTLDAGGDGSATGDGSSGSEGGAPADGGEDVSDSPQGEDRGVVDAGSDGPMDGAVACAPVPGNLLVNDNADFELGCASWHLTQGGSLTSSAQAHCGSMACQACPSASVAFDNLYANVNIPVFHGEQYQFQAYLRAADVPFSVAPIFGLNGGQIQGSDTALSGAYASISTTMTVIGDDTLVQVMIRLDHADGGCVLVDDALLLRVRDAGGD
jgi:hypothetical protein